MMDEQLLQDWDAVIVGTGPGSAAAGLTLARAGKRVLFCEEGGSPTGQFQANQAGYPELDGLRNGLVLDVKDAKLLGRYGRYFHEVVDESTPRVRNFVPYMGAGPGGSSALYGMALERFHPDDFVGGTGGPNSGTVWPIDYRTLAPYYTRAEALYRVRGEIDPLRTSDCEPDYAPVLAIPPRLSEPAADFVDFFRQQGLHPYRLPLACEFVSNCRTCQGLLCPEPCKNDSYRVCIEPAVRDHGAVYLSNCQVISVATQGRKAAGVSCRWLGREVEFRARSVVLGAGALQTPLILMRSRSNTYPDGLGSRSGLLGRNLMRHFIDLYAVRTTAEFGPFDAARKELAFNDFNLPGAERLGTVQSFGSLPPAEMLFGSLSDDISVVGGSVLPSIFRRTRPLMVPLLRRTFNNSALFATISEDLPHFDNWIKPVSLDSSDVRLRYLMGAESKAKVDILRRRMRDVFRGRKYRLLPQAENNHRLAHVCGTCKFGEDPASSVLDPNNRLHDLDNVFVVDSSFFPSSGSTNPSLTIIANGLRVGDLIARSVG